MASNAAVSWRWKNNKKRFCNNKSAFLYRYVMKISDRQPKISDSLKISDFSDSLGVKHPQQYAYDRG